MSEDQTNTDLHLPSLFVKGFRGIESLEIPRLGRATLLAGKNGVGKTTILEACRVYALRGYPKLLSDLGQEHEEYSIASDKEGMREDDVDLSGLFYGRQLYKNSLMEIGPSDSQGNSVKIEVVEPNKEQAKEMKELIYGIPDEYHFEKILLIKTAFKKQEHFSPYLIGLSDQRNLFTPYRKMRYWDQRPFPFQILKHETLGPGLISNDQLAGYWDEIALTEWENRITETLCMTLSGSGESVERVTMVGNSAPRSRHARRAVVKLSNHDKPVPLKSLGDGAIRLFSIALALANCRDGFLFLDEAENGIHHSILKDFWKFILKAARQNNTQVLATTHGWDCIKGFAEASKEDEESEGLLLRLEMQNGIHRAIEYSEDELVIAGEQNIEVR